MTFADHAREVRNALVDPHKLCAALGLAKHAKRQTSGLTVCCPAHGDRTPSCSVTVGPDGTVRVRCFACDFSGDALTLIATVEGVSLRSHFREVLARGADIAGCLQLRDEILAGGVLPEREPVAAPPRRAEPTYPPRDEVLALWGAGVPPSEDPDAWEYLRSRGIDPDALSDSGVAKVVRETPSRWCRYQGQEWSRTGHRLLVPMFDHRGELVSVRAWRIDPGDTPKRLPPAGHKATGLVMANRLAWLMLRRRCSALRLVIVEGEPDFCTAVVGWPGEAIVGLVSGAWTQAFADALPTRTEVLLCTHNDAAGERYAAQVLSTLGRRPAWRFAA